MKRKIRTIATVGTMTILLYGAYLLGTTQVDTVTDTHAKPLPDMESFKRQVRTWTIKRNSECTKID